MTVMGKNINKKLGVVNSTEPLDLNLFSLRNYGLAYYNLTERNILPTQTGELDYGPD